MSCPSACCAANVDGGLPGERVDGEPGDIGPMFVTKSGPMPGGGIGEPGTVLKRSLSLFGGTWSKYALGAVTETEGCGWAAFGGRRGVSLVSRECAALGARDALSMGNDANGSSPTSDDVLLAAPPRGRMRPGGGRPCAAAVPALPPGPMTSSTIRLRSTALDALVMGSTSCTFGGGHTASRKMEPVSAERIPMRWGIWAPGGSPPRLGVGDRCGSIGDPNSDGEALWNERVIGDAPGPGVLVLFRE